jgi:hypothetical protein
MSNAEACYSLWGLCISTKIDVGLFVTLGLFLAGIVTNSYVERRKKREARVSYIKALAEEIKLNVRSLEKAQNGFPALHEINRFMQADVKNRPYLTFSYFSVIYRSRTEVLQDLPDILIKNIVEFYGKLEDLSVDVTAIDKDAFIRISQYGREGAIADLFSDVRVVLQLGLSISDSIELLLSKDNVF